MFETLNYLQKLIVNSKKNETIVDFIRVIKEKEMVIFCGFK